MTEEADSREMTEKESQSIIGASFCLMSAALWSKTAARN
jgi:hypothetical protein